MPPDESTGALVAPMSTDGSMVVYESFPSDHQNEPGIGKNLAGSNDINMDAPTQLRPAGSTTSRAQMEGQLSANKLTEQDYLSYVISFFLAVKHRFCSPLAPKLQTTVFQMTGPGCPVSPMERTLNQGLL
jgi:hypothetical protein